MPKRLTSPVAGSVYALPLTDGTFAFGQVCEGGDYAFFDFKSRTIPEASSVVEYPVAFRIHVAVDARLVGKWKCIGVAPLRGALALYGRYRQQPVGSDKVYVYIHGKTTPATEDEVLDLETAAAWFSNHVTERLEDHFASRANKTAAILWLKR